MPHFNWDSTYGVKVKQFDDDHQELFRIINSLHDTLMARRGQEVQQNVLNELRYSEKHFAGEEAVMRSAGYPKLAAQIEQHRRFTAKIKELSATYQEASLGVTVDALDFLTEWLKKHILAMDIQYGDFLNAKGFA